LEIAPIDKTSQFFGSPFVDSRWNYSNSEEPLARISRQFAK